MMHGYWAALVLCLASRASAGLVPGPLLGSGKPPSLPPKGASPGHLPESGKPPPLPPKKLAPKPPAQQPRPPRQERPEWVYRGHGSAANPGPDGIMTVGGMAPQLEPNRPPQPTDSKIDPFSLYDHYDDTIDSALGRKHTVYVSTSVSLQIAVDFGAKAAKPIRRWVYRLRPTSNMVDMPKSFRTDRLNDEDEFSAMGGVRLGQIYDGILVPESFHSTKTKYKYTDWNDLVAKALAYWKEHPAEKKALGVQDLHWKNPRYEKKYDAVPEIKGHPLLAGLPASPTVTAKGPVWDKRWDDEPFKSIKIQDRVSPRVYAAKLLKEIAEPRGWLQNYPLFAQPETAVKKKGVEEAKRKKIGNFMNTNRGKKVVGGTKSL